MIKHNLCSTTAAFPVSSRAPRSSQEADADRWHLQMRHLGKEALKRLVSNVYGVKIRGPLTVNCQACLQAKAKKQISRRPSRRMAPRPLWRIRFDLFTLEKAYNQMRYAVVIQDEFTGYIWVYPLAGKTQEEFVQASRTFSEWLRPSMTSISVKFDGTTTNRSETSSMHGSSKKGSRMSPVHHISKSPMEAASDLGG